MKIESYEIEEHVGMNNFVKCCNDLPNSIKEITWRNGVFFHHQWHLKKTQ